MSIWKSPENNPRDKDKQQAAEQPPQLEQFNWPDSPSESAFDWRLKGKVNNGQYEMVVCRDMFNPRDKTMTLSFFDPETDDRIATVNLEGDFDRDKEEVWSEARSFLEAGYSPQQVIDRFKLLKKEGDAAKIQRIQDEMIKRKPRR